MEKSFFGYSKKIEIPLIIKIILFLLFSAIPFLKISKKIKFCVLFSLIIYRSLVLGITKKSMKLYFFLIISSIMICIFWWIFEKYNFMDYAINAVIKLWILFLSGNALLISINQEEVILFLKRIKCSSNVILFIIISLNSLCYFISSFNAILKSYKARNNDNNMLKKYTYALRTLSVDCLFLIVECKKTYTIYYKRIIESIEG